jgi:hypothetical protein
MADIINVDSGNPIYNGGITVNPGIKTASLFQYYRDRAITKPTIAEIEDKYDDRFPFYEPTG